MFPRFEQDKAFLEEAVCEEVEVVATVLHHMFASSSLSELLSSESVELSFDSAEAQKIR